MSCTSFSAAAAAAVASLTLLSPASAHVTLAQKQAAVGERYQAVLRVPHGCQGSPTVTLKVQVPDGLVGVKPQPKPGWTLNTVQGDYTSPQTLFGNPVTSGVREIAWSGGSLPDAHYDEFVFVGYLAADLPAGSTLYFPVVQECEVGTSRWIDRPQAGSVPAADHSDSPAPSLKLLPRQP